MSYTDILTFTAHYPKKIIANKYFLYIIYSKHYIFKYKLIMSIEQFTQKAVDTRLENSDISSEEKENIVESIVLKSSSFMEEIYDTDELSDSQKEAIQYGLVDFLIKIIANNDMEYKSNDLVTNLLNNIDERVQQTIEHDVMHGDILSQIAKDYGLKIEYLIDKNEIEDVDKINIGQSLTINIKDSKVFQVSDNDNLMINYKDENGDESYFNLMELLSKGITWDEIAEYNNISPDTYSEIREYIEKMENTPILLSSNYEEGKFNILYNGDIIETDFDDIFESMNSFGSNIEDFFDKYPHLKGLNGIEEKISDFMESKNFFESKDFEKSKEFLEKVKEECLEDFDIAKELLYVFQGDYEKKNVFGRVENIELDLDALNDLDNESGDIYEKISYIDLYLSSPVPMKGMLINIIGDYEEGGIEDNLQKVQKELTSKLENIKSTIIDDIIVEDKHLHRVGSLPKMIDKNEGLRNKIDELLNNKDGKSSHDRHLELFQIIETEFGDHKKAGELVQEYVINNPDILTEYGENEDYGYDFENQINHGDINELISYIQEEGIDNIISKLYKSTSRGGRIESSNLEHDPIIEKFINSGLFNNEHGELSQGMELNRKISQFFKRIEKVVSQSDGIIDNYINNLEEKLDDVEDEEEKEKIKKLIADAENDAKKELEVMLLQGAVNQSITEAIVKTNTNWSGSYDGNNPFLKMYGDIEGIGWFNLSNDTKEILGELAFEIAIIGLSSVAGVGLSMIATKLLTMGARAATSATIRGLRAYKSTTWYQKGDGFIKGASKVINNWEGAQNTIKGGVGIAKSVPFNFFSVETEGLIRDGKLGNQEGNRGNDFYVSAAALGYLGFTKNMDFRNILNNKDIAGKLALLGIDITAISALSANIKGLDNEDIGVRDVVKSFLFSAIEGGRRVNKLDKVANLKSQAGIDPKKNFLFIRINFWRF
ncbi:hypothetical protein VAMP_95n100 [Candidatus Vampirococcus lugosii]|uniref:LysM domain-containing protein n=2 Tax=Candidatus Vampirococcus lugosii TaxID=2789015 RepID=A0ABS5QLK3_9BACT|nr:hypothetical protein [Candidatus Vampirococcus lugosii]